MKSIPFGKRVIAACALLLAASCGDSTAPVDPALDDALQQFAVVDGLAAVAPMTGGSMVPHGIAPSACPFNATTKRFVCPTRTMQSLTMNLYYQLLDASGAPLSAWGNNVVAIRTVSDVAGTLTPSSGTPSANLPTLTISQHDESTLSGLQAERQTLNGIATQTLAQPGLAPASPMTRTTTNLVLPKRGVEQYPQSGSIATSLGSFVSTMTFNGTSTVTFTTTFGGGTTTTCTLNLAAPSTPPACG
jgi:hypothetical protein